MWWKPVFHCRTRSRVPSGDSTSCSGPGAACSAATDAATVLAARARSTATPPSQRINVPKGGRNSDALARKRMCMPSAKAPNSVYGMSQLLVCGAAMTTQRRARGSSAPSTRQPARPRMARATARIKGATTGVSKMVTAMAPSIGPAPAPLHCPRPAPALRLRLPA